MISLSSINRAEALRYMGQKGKEIPPALSEVLDSCEKKLLGTIRPNYVFRVFDIERKQDGIHICSGMLVLEGKDIADHLEGCSRAVLMCATLGADTDKLIRTEEITDISSAFVMDAMASAAIEEVCRIADEQIKQQIPGYFFTWRFSPGYGDFPISIQKEFLETLNASRFVGVCTGENNILVPRKSVTAVAGISENPLPKKRRGCACCNMAARCEFRKRGDHCGF